MKGRKSKNISLEEFKVLVNNIVPVSLEQAEWICSEVERLTHEHPELKRKIEEWGAEQMPESEKRRLEELFHRLLAEAERDKRET